MYGMRSNLRIYRLISTIAVASTLAIVGYYVLHRKPLDLTIATHSETTTSTVTIDSIRKTSVPDSRTHSGYTGDDNLKVSNWKYTYPTNSLSTRPATSKTSIPNSKNSGPKGAVTSKVSNWKYVPPTHSLSTRPAGTLHPDSLNPKRMYNTEPPNLPLCPKRKQKEISIYLESLQEFSRYQVRTGGFYPGKALFCKLPDNAVCKLQVNDKLADAVFRFVYFINSKWPLRYCKGQILITLNSEALRGTGPNYQQLDLADIRIDHFLTSDVLWKHICMEFPNIYKGFPPPDPAKRTKAVALFNSDCVFGWRTNYYKELMKYIPIDSYGKCFHNVDVEKTRFSDNFIEIVGNTLQSYRMMLTFENIIQQDYISIKIWQAYSGGAIPVYLGPPDIYDWVPGNHTFIDPRNFSGPKELAEYMKRVAEDDELFKYHTSNFDWDRTKRMMDKYCPKAQVLCNMCKMAYEKKMNPAEQS